MKFQDEELWTHASTRQYAPSPLPYQSNTCQDYQWNPKTQRTYWNKTCKHNYNRFNQYRPDTAAPVSKEQQWSASEQLLEGPINHATTQHQSIYHKQQWGPQLQREYAGRQDWRGHEIYGTFPSRLRFQQNQRPEQTNNLEHSRNRGWSYPRKMCPAFQNKYNSDNKIDHFERVCNANSDYIPDTSCAPIQHA